MCGICAHTFSAEFLGMEDQTSNFGTDSLWWTYLKTLFLDLRNYTSSLSLKLSVFYVAGNLLSCLFSFSQIFPLAHSTFPAGVRLGTHLLLSLEVGLTGSVPELWPPYKDSFVRGFLDDEETHQSMKFLSSTLGSSDKCAEHFTRCSDFLVRFLWLHSQHFPILTLEYLRESSEK